MTGVKLELFWERPHPKLQQIETHYVDDAFIFSVKQLKDKSNLK